MTTTRNSAALDNLVAIAVDLTANLSAEDRYDRLLNVVHQIIPCDASALLHFDGRNLRPLAIRGLAREVLGQNFSPLEHPRLATILAARDPVRFAADDPRPDPYDGLMQAGTSWSHVHSCMGCALTIEGTVVGALTVDALAPDRFKDLDDRTVMALAALAAAAVRTAVLIERLHDTVKHRDELNQYLVRTAWDRSGAIVGQSEIMMQLAKEVETIAQTPLNVLIMGETGVGKEVVARTLHAKSLRSAQPLVHVNCAALPESIAESELFGHLRGAFTGAVDDRAGKFELAAGGTLFLDEIGELPLTIQPKLLRALQEGEIQRVGADRNIRVDVRIIAATNRDLQQEVRAGRFRADLYHRLSVYPLVVPPLRDRGDDILLLSGFVLDRVRLQLGLGPTRLSPAARTALRSYSWPGNVRELEHVLMRASLRAAQNQRHQAVLVDDVHLDLDKKNHTELSAKSEVSLKEMQRPRQSLSKSVDEFQRRLIQEALMAAGGNWAAVARELELDRGNLYRLAKRLGLK